MQAESGEFCQAWGFLARGTSQLLFVWEFVDLSEILGNPSARVEASCLCKRFRLDAKLVGVASQGVTRTG